MNGHTAAANGTPEMPARIRAIFFDVDDTIFTFGRCSAASMRYAAARQGLSLPSSIEAVFKEVNDRLWQELEQQRLTRAGLHAVRWQTIFARLGIDGDPAMFEKDYCAAFAESHEQEPGAESLIRTLSGRYPLYVATNSTVKQQSNRLSNAGLLPCFRRIFASEDVGAPKPQKAFFDACFAELPGIRPEQTALIGDSLTADIDGAHAYGIHTIWYDRNSTGKDVPEAEYTVQTLGGILPILMPEV